MENPLGEWMTRVFGKWKGIMSILLSFYGHSKTHVDAILCHHLIYEPLNAIIGHSAKEDEDDVSQSFM